MKVFGEPDATFYKSCLKEEVYKGKKPSFRERIRAHSRYSESRALWLLRSMQYYFDRSGIGPAKYVFHRCAMWCMGKLRTDYGIFVDPHTPIGKGLSLPHPNGIIIGRNVLIGERCTIYQQVTLGAEKMTGGEYPEIGDDCIFYAKCTVVGPITVADRTVVGANSFLNKSTETGSIYAGIPARRIR